MAPPTASAELVRLAEGLGFRDGYSDGIGLQIDVLHAVRTPSPPDSPIGVVAPRRFAAIPTVRK